MSPKRLRLLAGVCLLLAGAWAAHAADPAVSRRDAELLKKKIAAITGHSTAAPSSRRLTTTVTEREVNAYLTYEMQDELPPGVVSPVVSILGTGRVTGRAIVDLDKVRRERKPTGLLDPMSYLTGRLPVSATGLLRTGNGLARFELESAQVAGLPIPKALLQQIVAHYSRSLSRPSGFSLDETVAMPARIREVQIQRGRAVVVQ
jgi:hypothetical protein